MASHAPAACCTQASFHEGQAQGEHKQIFGLDTYQVGAEHGNDRVIVILTDIFGNRFNNVLLIADEIARSCKYHVVIPDILKGDAVPLEHGDLSGWLTNHTSDITAPIVNGFLQQLRKEWSPKFVGGIGYCYGAKYAIQNISKDGFLDAAAGAHPSFVEVDEIKAIAKPIIISAAEVDPLFTRDLRWKTEEILTDIKARYQMDLFQGVSHGFSVKGDISDPIVKYAKEKTLSDQLLWFAQFN
ncbi:dienelactone hydrolase [Hyphopichia burtonii NRRL Y-1933]|uniref:Dienelactone hydrolase n=1 Tax=Hyphopichia burtonii NRRL Y-1933 TaxID=984485 RepID=A0A1E4RHQ1_9ASCO|nr:dienelactone hydrolase [Hyphopichia burtonii NRRL Y-1933]ODV66635.1 dienelactone hydrolase [Hyphopichia burtonii NRRL Y-1933]